MLYDDECGTRSFRLYGVRLLHVSAVFSFTGCVCFLFGFGVNTGLGWFNKYQIVALV